MSIYDFTLTSSEGKEIHLSDYRGKVLLLVNTATKCGLAGQFTELEALHMKYGEKGLVVIGFPCNQFLNQEPESNEAMASVCQINFGVTFLLSQKIEVNGEGAHPLFMYLKKKLKGGIFSSKIKWNFTKFLIARDGTPYKRYAPTVSPLSFEADIEKLLKETPSSI
jgi:glutathione peroxidase